MGCASKHTNSCKTLVVTNLCSVPTTQTQICLSAPFLLTVAALERQTSACRTPKGGTCTLAGTFRSNHNQNDPASSQHRRTKSFPTSTIPRPPVQHPSPAGTRVLLPMPLQHPRATRSPFRHAPSSATLLVGKTNPTPLLLGMGGVKLPELPIPPPWAREKEAGREEKFIL